MIRAVYCSKCGYKIQNSYTICPRCGNKINLVSTNVATISSDFKFLLSFFLIGIIVLESLKTIGSYIIIKTILNGTINSFQSYNLYYSFSFLLEFIFEISLILFLLKLLKKYDFTLSKDNMINYLIQIFIFAGIGSLAYLFIQNYLLYPVLDSISIYKFFVLMSPNEFIFFLPIQVFYNSFTFLMLFVFAFLLQERTNFRFNLTHRLVYFEFFLISVFYGFISLILMTDTANFIPVNISIFNILFIIFLILNLIIIIIPLIIALIMSKFIHFLITDTILINFVFVITMAIFFKLVGIVLFFPPGTYNQTFLGLLVYLGTYNISVTLNLVISLFASLYLIQMYRSKILSKEPNTQNSTVKNKFTWKSLFQRNNPQILETNNIDKSLETIEQIIKENSENK